MNPPWGTPYNGLYREVSPEGGSFFRLRVYERVGISLVKYIKGQGNLSLRSVRGLKRANRLIL